MSDEQPAAPAGERSIEDRMASYFGAKETPSEPQESGPAVAAPQTDNQAPINGHAQEAPDDGSENQEEQEGQQPQFEEIDWEDGNRYQIPVALKPALMKEADYRQKTMELKSIRQAVEAERITQTLNASFVQQVQPIVQEQQRLLSLKEQAKKLDWTSLTTDQKIDLDRELRGVDEKLVELSATYQQQQAQYNQQFGNTVLGAVSATENFMSQMVPGWSQATGKELHDYGLALGIPKAKLVTGWFADPAATISLWKAKQWDQLQAGKPQTMNKAGNAPPVIRPNSNASQQSTRQVTYQKARQDLKKTGSLESFASALLASQRKR